MPNRIHEYRRVYTYMHMYIHLHTHRYVQAVVSVAYVPDTFLGARIAANKLQFSGRRQTINKHVKVLDGIKHCGEKQSRAKDQDVPGWGMGGYCSLG